MDPMDPLVLAAWTPQGPHQQQVTIKNGAAERGLAWAV